MTTEAPTPAPRPARRRGPRWDLDPRALRLWTATGLAVTYLVAWWCFAPAPQLSAEPEPPPAARAPVVWWHELPPGERPVVTLPPGWTVAPPTAAPTVTPTAAPGRRPPTRRVRIRTRSS